MKCEESRAVLVDAVEGELSDHRWAALQEHLSGCAECRREFDRLHNASRALRDTVRAVAPEQSYLTPARRRRLVAAYRERHRTTRLFTWRRVVAAAAVAAIVASLPFIVSDILRLLEPSGERTIVQDRQRPTRMAVVFVSTDRAGAEGTVRFDAARVGTPRGWEPPRGRLAAVPADSPGFRVPVDNAFYDPQQSSLWW